MKDRRLRLPLAILVVAGAAAAATLILRPRNGLIEPAKVDVEAYFSAHQLERANSFRDPQRLIGLAGIAVTGGTLAFMALGRRGACSSHSPAAACSAEPRPGPASRWRSSS